MHNKLGIRTLNPSTWSLSPEGVWTVCGSAQNLEVTQRLHSSSFLGLPYRILNMNPKKELLLSLRVFSTDPTTHEQALSPNPHGPRNLDKRGSQNPKLNKAQGLLKPSRA